MIASRSSGSIRWTGYRNPALRAPLAFLPRLSFSATHLALALSFGWACFAVPSFAVPNAVAQDAPPPTLASRIDAAVGTQLPIPTDPTDQGVLLRRVYLNLIGIPPRLSEIDAFLASDAPDKYQQTVDALLQRPEFNEHWVERFDVMLMERRPNTTIPQDAWRAWLHARIEADRPLNEWFAELIEANGEPGDQRAAARFILDRDADPHLITRDIGRIFFGRDLQCAQCHDHPLIDSYYQTDYHGLLGFVASLTKVEVADGEAKIQMVAEKSTLEAPFESVFNRGTQRRVTPHIPGEAELPRPWVIPGEDYDAPATAGHPSLPRQSPRRQLAELIRQGQHEGFRNTLANRVWALIFGRGVQEPVDLTHAENPPRYPELLDVLGNGLSDQQFQLRSFVRQIVLSNVYQRGPAPLRYGPTAEPSLAQPLMPGSTAPAWLNELTQQVTALQSELTQQIEAAKTALHEAEQSHETAETACTAPEAERLAAMATVDAARTALTQTLDARTKLAGEEANLRTARDQAADKASKLKTATDSAAAALAAVGEDAELKAAVDLLTQRTTAADAALVAAEQSLAAKATEVANINAQADQQRAAVIAAQTVVDDVNTRLAPVRQAANAARNSCMAAEHRLIVLQRNELLHNQILTCAQLFKTPSSDTSPEALASTLSSIAAGLNNVSATTPTDQNDVIAQQLTAVRTTAAQVESARGQLESLASQLAASQQQLEGLRQQQVDALMQLERMLTEDFYCTGITPLSPEQIGWTTLHVTGVLDSYIAKHAAELEKEAPATEEQKADPNWVAGRHAAAVRRARAELQGNVNTFINLYGAGAGQPQGDFFATADQALFTSNGGSVFAWAGPSGGNVTQAVIDSPDATTAAARLYRGILGRDPNVAEIQSVDQFLQSDPNQRARLAQEMVWSLMAGAEFRFNH